MPEKKAKEEGGGCGACCQCFMKFLYNSETGEVMWRTGGSWLKLTIFYVTFFLALAAFFALMLYIFYLSISANINKPHYVLEDSLITDNPGVGFRPQPDQGKNVDSTLIWFNTMDKTDVDFWSNQLNDYIKGTQEANSKTRKLEDCSFETDSTGTDSKVCKVDTTNLGECGGGKFGYDTGRPCVLLKLNKIFDWEPVGFGGVTKKSKFNASGWEATFDSHVEGRNKGEGPKHAECLDDIEPLKADMKRAMAGKSEQVQRGLYRSVWIHCDGENPLDQENLGKITYLPHRFIPSYHYPFTGQQGYVSPFIMLQFNGLTPGVVVNVACKAFAQNIFPSRQTRAGSVHFEIMMESRKP